MEEGRGHGGERHSPSSAADRERRSNQPSSAESPEISRELRRTAAAHRESQRAGSGAEPVKLGDVRWPLLTGARADSRLRAAKRVFGGQRTTVQVALTQFDSQLETAFVLLFGFDAFGQQPHVEILQDVDQ